jgi:hypothetical protein
MRALPLDRILRSLAVATASVVACWFAPAARADDPPVHSMYDMALAEGATPEGWKLVKEGGAPDENAVKDAIAAIAKEKGLAGDKGAKIHFVTRSVTSPEGKKAVFVLADLDDKSDEFVAAVKEAATAKGWTFREMGAPTRLLFVSAPEDVREKALAIQLAYAVKQLVARAQSALENHSGLERILGYSDASLAVEPKNGPANFLRGRIQLALYNQSREDKELDKGIANFRAVFAKDATGDVTAKDRTMAQGELGSLLLQKGGPSVEARDALKEAVAGKANIERQALMGYVYNLACAHARLKELDDAFKHLSDVLEENSKVRVEGIEHWREGDPDFDNLKSDARWTELTKKYPPSASRPSDGN